MAFSDFLQRLEARGPHLKAAAQRPAVKRALTAAKAAVLIAVVSFILWRLGRIGWRDVASNIPLNPLFYILFLARFSLMPLSETVIYGWLWERNLWPRVALFWRKRVLNMSVLEAAGEAYLIAWATERLGVPFRKAAATVKDANLMLIAAGNTITVALIALAALLGGFTDAGLSGHQRGWLYAFASVFGVMAAVIWLARGALLHTPTRIAARVYGVHLGRLTLIAIIVCLQWTVAIPGAPLETWIVFFALYFALTRIPFLPSKETIFVSIGLLLSDYVPASDEAVAGMLASWAAMTEIANAVIYFATTKLDVGPKPEACAEAEAQAKAGPEA